VAKKKAKISSNKNSNLPDFDSNISKYFFLVIPILTVIYYISSKYSVGYYQDDEIGHFLNMVQFWSDPGAIVANWPKFGYKVFMVVPSLMGYDAVLIANSLVSAFAVYLTYYVIRLYKINYAFLGAILLASQPLFFDLSFRSYGEIFTAVLLLLLVIFYKKEKFVLAGLTCGYVYLVRQEAVLIAFFLLIIFLRKKEFIAILCIGIFPIIFNLLGYLKTGDILFVISEMNALGAMDFGGAERGFFHYFKIYIFIIGPVCLALFMLGFFGFDPNKLKEYVIKYDILYVIFAITFLVQALLMVQGVNPGTWRYMLHISPIAAIFATIGFNKLADPSFRKRFYILTGFLILATLIFSSKEANGLELTENSDFSLLIVLLIFGGLVLLISNSSPRAYLNKLSILFIILSIGSTVYSFEPRQLSPENISVKEVAEYTLKPQFKDKGIYYTHTNLVFYSNLSGAGMDKYIPLDMKSLSEAKSGDIIIWDTHYGYRPEYKKDVQLQVLEDSTSFKLLNQFISSDRRFAAYVFEKN
jgi:hypothetical protein